MSQDGNDSTESCSRAGSIVVTRKSKAPEGTAHARSDVFGSGRRDAEPHPTKHDLQPDTNVAWDMLGGIPALGFGVDGLEAFDNVLGSHQALSDDLANDLDAVTKQKKPFHKWMNTIRRRAAHRHTIVGYSEDVSLEPPRFARIASTIRRRGHRRHSSSGSSFGFVTSIKSASVSLATASIMARSRRTTLRSSQAHSRTDRSSRASMSGNRASEDSSYLERSLVMDKAVVERSLQRRRILEELIHTEESYIGDIRFLMNVYVTILVSLPTLPMGLRSSINRNLADIVELHEEMLGELHRAVPHSEYTQLAVTPSEKRAAPGHHRWRSLDAVPEDREGLSWLDAVPGMIAEPHVAADVAKIFARKMGRFFVYEEYGAKYEMMMKDIASAYRTMPQWETYQKGLEALAASLHPGSRAEERLKKSSTIGDLLVKPIQRVCKYPLLFAELLKYTPVCDCPHSHMEIEDTLVRLREATAEINRATDDVHVRAVLQKTWLLQDRLVFPDQKLDTASKSCIRSFGHIQLCGVLHVCWQTREGVDGKYMISLLYRDWLCLATGSKVEQVYTIQACIPLADMKLEAPDNGRGLQCHTAPYTWKVVFECDCQLYEIIMTACTSREETEWRSRLFQVLTKGPLDVGEAKTFNFLSLNIKGLGTVFGKQGTVARRMSIHRATTVGPKSPLSHIILKNTTMEKDPTINTPSTSINRSQSLLATTGRVPVLAPSPGDRARLEALVSDVWTRDVLPFPGMTARARSEHAVRSSASSMIRKLSVTSIASTFTKRSPSVTSMSKNMSDEGTELGKESQKSSDTAQAASAGPAIFQAVDPMHSRLSIIDDDSEKHSPSATRIQSGELSVATTDGSGHRLVTVSSPAAFQLDQAVASSPVNTRREVAGTHQLHACQMRGTR